MFESLFKEIKRENWMFKLVGKENFDFGKHKCMISIEATNGFAYEYSLEIDGKSYEKFCENQSKVLQSWVFKLDNQDTRIVLEKNTMDIWVNGHKLDIEVSLLLIYCFIYFSWKYVIRGYSKNNHQTKITFTWNKMLKLSYFEKNASEILPLIIHRYAENQNVLAMMKNYVSTQYTHKNVNFEKLSIHLINLSECAVHSHSKYASFLCLLMALSLRCIVLCLFQGRIYWERNRNKFRNRRHSIEAHNSEYWWQTLRTTPCFDFAKRRNTARDIINSGQIKPLKCLNSQLCDTWLLFLSLILTLSCLSFNSFK